jgi:hypothetical protein
MPDLSDVGPLVDSTDIAQRSRTPDGISAMFRGLDSATTWQLKAGSGHCPCPIPAGCQHVAALRITYELRPQTFRVTAAHHQRS